jgi:hypothetical protein
MSRLLISLTLLASPIFGQVLSQGERDYAASALHGTRKQFLDTLGPLSEAQMKWKPGPAAWSVAEVAEHIVTSEDFLPGVVTKLMAGPATPEKKKANPRETDFMLMKVLPVREQKAQAPEPLKPTGKYPNKAALLSAFRAARDRNIAYVRDTSDDLRVHFAPHPLFGELDGLQWYILIAGHTERHLNQMKEVMASPGFPAR